MILFLRAYQNLYSQKTSQACHSNRIHRFQHKGAFCLLWLVPHCNVVAHNKAFLLRLQSSIGCRDIYRTKRKMERVTIGPTNNTSLVIDPPHCHLSSIADPSQITRTLFFDHSISIDFNENIRQL